MGRSLSFAWRLGFLYAALFLVVGCYLPYFPVWLDWRRFGADQIAILLAAPLFTRILCTPVISFIAGIAVLRFFEKGRYDPDDEDDA